jgi:hypothetical protein
MPTPLPGMILVAALTTLPNPQLTPGEAFPHVTSQDICTPGYATHRRHVTAFNRERSLVEYGIPESERDKYVLDHLIPLELGGDNSLRNLWPEPRDTTPNAADKDYLENDLHRLVCSGAIPLSDAQRCIAVDWISCWHSYGN